MSGLYRSAFSSELLAIAVLPAKTRTDAFDRTARCVYYSPSLLGRKRFPDQLSDCVWVRGHDHVRSAFNHECLARLSTVGHEA